MEAFVKSYASYRTIKKATVITREIVTDSLEAEPSSAVLAGSSIGYDDVGNWLILEGTVFWISGAKPEAGRVTLSLSHPLEAFSRPLELSEQPAAATIGGFVTGVLNANWIQCSDPDYKTSYLVVSNSDTTPYVNPETDASGCFDLPGYCRLMRKGYRTLVQFVNKGDSLECTISGSAESSRQISFEDGRSQLQRFECASSGVAKITALCDVPTGEKDANGDAVKERTRSTWYLSEAGEISQTVPEHRAAGKWITILVKNPEDVEAKVIETFAKNKSDHKIEFFSTLDLNVQDACLFFVNNRLLRSYITCKKQTNGSNRYFYRAGELATTVTEKLRGVMK